MRGKWDLLLGALEADAGLCAGVLLISSLLSAGYFFRVIERIYFAESPPAVDQNRSRRRPELPMRLLGPVITLGAAVLVVGFFNGRLVTTVIRHALPELGQ